MLQDRLAEHFSSSFSAMAPDALNLHLVQEFRQQQPANDGRQ